MKLRYKIVTGFVALLALIVIGLALVLSHDSPCTPPPAAGPGTAAMQAVTYTCYGGPLLWRTGGAGRCRDRKT
jgi:hypothetical protein